MDMNSWSLVLGVAGFFLGLISAFAQLKTITSVTLRFGGDRARRWAARRAADASTFAVTPSALIAYLAQCVLFFVASLLAVLVVGGLSKDPALAFPSWLSPTVNFVVACLIGIKLASIQSMVGAVRRKATAAHADSLVGG